MVSDKIQKLLERAVAEGDNMGCSALVLKEGKEVAYCQAGYADREADKKIERDSMFRIFSMSKPVTAVAVMKLVEEGELILVEPVCRYLYGFEDQKVMQEGALVPVKQKVLIKDLMNMTSGLVYPDPDTIPGKAVAEIYKEIDAGVLSTMDAANRFGQCPLAFQPGEGWRYGVSADVLGGIVEAVSGMKFGTFLREKIFEPLGMNDTDFYVPKEKFPRLTRTYSLMEDRRNKEDRTKLLGISVDMKENPSFESGGAGLVSTIDDYGCFGSMLNNDGWENGNRILQPATVRFLTNAGLAEKPQREFISTISNSLGFTYGNLMRVTNDRRLAGNMVGDGQYGWDGALGTLFANFPGENITIIYMMQRMQGGKMDVCSRLCNIVMSSF